METAIIIILLILMPIVPLVILHFIAGGVGITFYKPHIKNIKRMILSLQKEEVIGMITLTIMVIIIIGISVFIAIKLLGDWIYIIVTLPFVGMAFMAILGFYYWAIDKRSGE